MNHDHTPPPPSPPPDPALEARIVAWVAGELSAVEIADLAPLVAADPELTTFKRRIESVHGLVAEAERPDPAPLRLSADRRAKLLQILGASETAPATTTAPASSAAPIVALPTAPRRRGWNYGVWLSAAAACLMIGLFLSMTVPHFGLAKKPIRPEPASTGMSSRDMSTSAVVDSDIRSAEDANTQKKVREAQARSAARNASQDKAVLDNARQLAASASDAFVSHDRAPLTPDQLAELGTAQRRSLVSPQEISSTPIAAAADARRQAPKPSSTGASIPPVPPTISYHRLDNSALTLQESLQAAARESIAAANTLLPPPQDAAQKQDRYASTSAFGANEAQQRFSADFNVTAPDKAILTWKAFGSDNATFGGVTNPALAEIDSRGGGGGGRGDKRSQIAAINPSSPTTAFNVPTTALNEKKSEVSYDSPSSSLVQAASTGNNIYLAGNAVNIQGGMFFDKLFVRSNIASPPPPTVVGGGLMLGGTEPNALKFYEGSSVQNSGVPTPNAQIGTQGFGVTVTESGSLGVAGQNSFSDATKNSAPAPATRATFDSAGDIVLPNPTGPTSVVLMGGATATNDGFFKDPGPVSSAANTFAASGPVSINSVGATAAGGGLNITTNGGNVIPLTGRTPANVPADGLVKLDAFTAGENRDSIGTAAAARTTTVTAATVGDGFQQEGRQDMSDALAKMAAKRNAALSRDNPDRAATLAPAPSAPGAIAGIVGGVANTGDTITLSAFSVAGPVKAKKGETKVGAAPTRPAIVADSAVSAPPAASARAISALSTGGKLAPTPPLEADEPRPAARTRQAPVAPAEETTTAKDPVSTFSLHVSDVSFRLAQAALARGELPDPARIRPEEFYNAFDYGEPAATAAEKIGARIEQGAHPFLQQRNLVRVALKVPATGRGAGTPLHLTVLLDTSGSMEREDRAASVRRALEVLVSLLGRNDRLTLIGFARTPRLLAENLRGDQARSILDLLARTPSEGGTNLEEALKLGGELARRHRAPNAQNRLVLLTDGAANLGDAEPAHLMTMVTALRQSGIAFDACGVGLNGLDDEILEALTREGDGRYYVLDSPEAADAGFARQLAGAFRPAAENVKVQVRFNPARVGHYRLIGFEQHRLREEDFRNDKVDAAELAAEEAAVALYQVEVLPQGEGELGELFVRFRDPATKTMVERSWSLPYDAHALAFDRAAPSLQLAGTAALFAEKLRSGPAAADLRLRDLAPYINTLRGQYAQQPRVQDLVTMFAQARRLLND